MLLLLPSLLLSFLLITIIKIFNIIILSLHPFFLLLLLLLLLLFFSSSSSSSSSFFSFSFSLPLLSPLPLLFSFFFFFPLFPLFFLPYLPLFTCVFLQAYIYISWIGITGAYTLYWLQQVQTAESKTRNAVVRRTGNESNVATEPIRNSNVESYGACVILFVNSGLENYLSVFTCK